MAEAVRAEHLAPSAPGYLQARLHKPVRANARTVAATTVAYAQACQISFNWLEQLICNQQVVSSSLTFGFCLASLGILAPSKLEPCPVAAQGAAEPGRLAAKRPRNTSGRSKGVRPCQQRRCWATMGGGMLLCGTGGTGTRRHCWCVKTASLSTCHSGGTPLGQAWHTPRTCTYLLYSYLYYLLQLQHFLADTLEEMGAL